MNADERGFFTVKKTFSQSDFDRFAVLSGDDNPIHVDPDFARRTKYGRTVAHGMFLYSSVCAALNKLIPGMAQLEQEMMFPHPTFTAEEVTISLKLVETDVDGIVAVETVVSRPDGNVGLQGKTWVVGERSSVIGERYAAGREFAAADQGLVYQGLQVGQQASETRAFTTADVAEYVALVGDENARYMAGGIVPGGLLGGMFSDLLGTRLPGRGTNWLKQRLIFPRAAKVGEEITAVVAITRIRPPQALVNLRTTCTNPAGELVCIGESLVLINELEQTNENWEIRRLGD